MSDPRDRVVQAAREWNEARLAATTGAASRYGPTLAESARLAKAERALSDAVNAPLPADMTSGDEDTRPTIEVASKRPNNDEKLTTIDVWFDDLDEAERAFDAIEKLLGDMGQIGTLRMTSGDGWRPIESAPRNGSWFLWCAADGVARFTQAVIRWPEYYECFHQGWWQPLPATPTPKPEGE